MPEGANSISVCVRVRPFTVREAAQLVQAPDGPLFLGDGSLAGHPTPKLNQKGLRPVIKVIDDKCLSVFDPPEDNPVQRLSKVFQPRGKRSKDQTFAFDRVFDENTTQADVYEATTKTLLDSVLDGYNATVFAYGATGCGKTHTITGTIQDPGIIFLTMQELFERIQERSEEKVTDITLSYLEIYNETIRDLLEPGGSKQGLMLREDSTQTVSVAGLSSHRPKDVQQVMDMIVEGNERRTISPTEANATSSRSHAVLQINIAQRDRNADVDEPHTMATLSIIDLAGSERASATKNRGERLLEGANINKSLLALGSCINALCDPKKRNHVPYRNSKLTRLLKFSLGGNCKTVMIVCVSPSSAHFDETQNTLRYANRAKNIQTKVTKNIYNVNRHVKDYLIKIEEQRALIDELKAQQRDYEAVSFAKFQKQSAKMGQVALEGTARIRNAYDHASEERAERINSMKRLRQIEKRIAILESWIASFDEALENEEDESVLSSLAAMRKTAQGVVVELESSRHHYHQKIAKNNWTRAIDSALQNGLRQLHEIGGPDDSRDADNLTREAELLKSNAEREALLSVSRDDQIGDTSTVRVLLKAHFETIAAVRGLMSRNEQEAIDAAKRILSKVLQSCTTVTSHVVKPDGSVAPVEHFAPSKSGTPKRKKQMNLLVNGASPLKHPAVAALAVPSPQMSQISSSPLRASPKRRKFGGPKRGIQFGTPKKSPVKAVKRGVRWRDDTEDGTLAEFEKTPKKFESSPLEDSTTDQLPSIPSTSMLPPTIPTDENDSSPVPSAPEPSLDIKSKSNRFRSGFLAKKASNGSPPPTSSLLSSDSDTSPFRVLTASSGNARSSFSRGSKPEDSTTDSGNASASGSADECHNWAPGKEDALHVKKAIKRRQSSLGSASAIAPRAQRRRSPSATANSSPPSDNMFTAGHVRRMVRSERDDGRFSVLSPRAMPVVKVPSAASRRTIGGDGIQVNKNHHRMSSVGGAAGNRNSIISNKTVWR